MSRVSAVFFLLAVAVFSFSCKTGQGVSPSESLMSEVTEINGDVFVEKNHSQPLLFSPDMKEYRLYGSLAKEIADTLNYNIVFLRGIVGESRDPDGRIPFEVLEILKEERR